MSSETQQPHEAGAQREADVYDLLAWLEVNKNKVAIVAVVLVVIGFGIATVRYFNEQKELKASGALLALKPTLTPNTNNPPVAPTELLKVAQQYGGTTAAARAHVLAATAFFTEGRYADAEKEFSKFVQEHPDSPWVAQAAYGVGASQEAQNKLTEAQASYQNVVTAYASTAIADDAKLALARIYELTKKPDQALRLYNELLAPKPGSQPGMMGNPAAFEQKESLLRAHPELDTNVAARPLPPAALLPGSTGQVVSATTSNAAPVLPETNAPARAAE
jgi:tetratricopeptide (TPR) repeat protein